MYMVIELNTAAIHAADSERQSQSTGLFVCLLERRTDEIADRCKSRRHACGLNESTCIGGMFTNIPAGLSWCMLQP